MQSRGRYTVTVRSETRRRNRAEEDEEVKVAQVLSRRLNSRHLHLGHLRVLLSFFDVPAVSKILSDHGMNVDQIVRLSDLVCLAMTVIEL